MRIRIRIRDPGSCQPWIRDPGSRMKRIGSRINIPDSQHWTSYSAPPSPVSLPAGNLRHKEKKDSEKGEESAMIVGGVGQRELEPNKNVSSDGVYSLSSLYSSSIALTISAPDYELKITPNLT
jgi:hypothetical protein